MTAPSPISLLPDAARAASRDAAWRARLVVSFDYLAEVLAARGIAADRLLDARSKAADGPVSPWVSCLYSLLVAEISRAEGANPGEAVAALAEAAARPARETAPAPLDDAGISPVWRAQFLRLIDTDRELPFRPVAPSPADAERCVGEIAAALDLLDRADPLFRAELDELLRVVVLGAPETADSRDDFGACSTFFMRELVLINAARRRSPVRMIDTLVHEASHVLLFGLALDQPLTTDKGEARIRSAARDDPRPLEGVFHAAFVMARVHLAMTRMIASGRLTPAEAGEAAERRDRNGEVARDALAAVAGHASLTPLGAKIVEALGDYLAPLPAAA